MLGVIGLIWQSSGYRGMIENRVYIVFGIIGLVLAITGGIVSIFSREMGMAWALVGSGLAII